MWHQLHAQTLVILFISFFIGAETSTAQGSLHTSIGSPAIAARAGIHHFARGSLAMFGNPSGMVAEQGWSFALGSEMRYLLPDLRFSSLAISRVSAQSALGLVVQSFGIDAFREHQIGLGYARALSSELSIGMAVDWFRLQIDSYGSVGWGSLRLGVDYLMIRDLQLAMSLVLPIDPIHRNELLPLSFSVGMKYQVAPQINLLADIRAQANWSDLALAMEYQIKDRMKCALGVRALNGWSFGISLPISAHLTFDLASYFHHHLGQTSISMGLTYN